jgi:hypothetical protein
LYRCLCPYLCSYVYKDRLLIISIIKFVPPGYLNHNLRCAIQSICIVLYMNTPDCTLWYIQFQVTIRDYKAKFAMLSFCLSLYPSYYRTILMGNSQFNTHSLSIVPVGYLHSYVPGFLWKIFSRSEFPFLYFSQKFIIYNEEIDGFRFSDNFLHYSWDMDL